MLKRFFASIAAALFVVLATAGCIKLDGKLTVSTNDTVSGTVTVAFDNSIAPLINQQTITSAFPAAGKLFKSQPGLTVTKYADGNYSGYSYLFNSIPLEKFATAKSDVAYLQFHREGDNIHLTGLLDTTSIKTLANASPVSPTELNLLYSNSKIRLVVTLPGTISYTTGKLSGNTITWTGAIGDRIIIGAVATSKPDVINWPLIGGISTFVIAAIAGGVLYFILKKRDPLYGVRTH